MQRNAGIDQCPSETSYSFLVLAKDKNVSNSSPDLTTSSMDPICEEFEAAWKLGQSPRLEDYVQRLEDPSDEIGFRRLVRLEAKMRERSGRTVDWNDLRNQFPDQISSVDRLEEELNQTITGAGRSIDVMDQQANREQQTRDFNWTKLGDYELIDQIGRGGMGIVFKGLHVKLNRFFAVKVLPVGSTSSRSARARFQIEAKAAAQLDHPNIVPVYAFGIQNGTYYYAMQLIDGGNLASVINGIRDLTHRSGEHSNPTSTRNSTIVDSIGNRSTANSGDSADSFDLVDAVTTKQSIATRDYLRAFARIGIQVADALHYAHITGIVHRDIKPSNLLVDPHGNIFVSDFGLARVQGETELTATGSILGTLRYMSPEQAYAQRIVVDHRTDLFSLGATLYELLLLEHAFDGRTKPEVLRQIAFEDPTAPRKINPKIPRDIETIVLKCLEKNPDARYQTGAEIAADLRAWLGDNPISAQRPTIVQRSVKWAKKHRALVGSAAATLLVSTLTIIAFLVLDARRQAAASEIAKQQNKELRAALVESEGRRLTAVAAQEVNRDPELAAALATKGLELHPTPEGRNTLLEANDANHQQLLIRQDHQMGMSTFSPDGNSILAVAIANSSPDSDIRPAKILDAVTGEQRVEIRSDHSVTSAIFDPDGRRVLVSHHSTGVAGQSDQDLPGHPPRIYSAETGNLIGEFLGAIPLRLHRSVFRPSTTVTTIVLPGVDNTVRLYNAAGDQTQIIRGHQGRVVDAAFSRDGKKIVSIGLDHTVRVWDAETGKPLNKLDQWNRRLPQDQFRAIQYTEFNQDATRLITASSLVGVEVWDLENETATSCGSGQFATFSPDEEQIAIIDYESARILDADSFRVVCELGPHDRKISQLEFSADSSKVMTNSHSRAAYLWDSVSGELLSELRGHSSAITHVAFHPQDERIVTAARDRTVRVWTMKSGVENSQFPMATEPNRPTVRISEDGTRLLATTSVERSSTLWTADLGERQFRAPQRASLPDDEESWFVTFDDHSVTVRAFPGGQPQRSFNRRIDRFRDAQISPDGQTVFITTDQSDFWIWNWQDGKKRRITLGDEHVVTAKFHPQNNLIFTVGSGGAIRSWNRESGEMDQEYRDSTAFSLIRFSPDGERLLAVAKSQKVHVLDVESFRRITTIEGKTLRVSRAEFSASGKSVVTCTTRGSFVSCWDATTGDLLHQVRSPPGRLQIVPHPDQEVVFVNASEAGIHVLDLESGEIVSKQPGRFDAIGFQPSSNEIVAAAAQPQFIQFAAARPGSPDFQLNQLVRFDWETWKSTQKTTTGAYSVGSIECSKRSGTLVVREQSYGLSVCEVDSCRQLASAAAHAGPITFAAYTKDDKRIVTGSLDGTAIVRDATTLDVIHILSGHSAPIVSATLHTDGKHFATADSAGTIQVWDLSDGKTLQTLNGLRGAITDCSFSAFAVRLAAFTRDGSWKVWQVNSGAPVKMMSSIADLRVQRAQYAPGGEKLLLFPRPPRSGKIDQESEDIQTLTFQRFSLLLVGENENVIELPHDYLPRSIRFSADGNLLITIAGDFDSIDGETATFWDVANGKVSSTVKSPGQKLILVDIDHDHRRVLMHHGVSIRLQTLYGKELITLTGQQPFDIPKTMDHLSADGSVFLAVSPDDTVRRVFVDPMKHSKTMRSFSDAERSRFRMDLPPVITEPSAQDE